MGQHAHNVEVREDAIGARVQLVVLQTPDLVLEKRLSLLEVLLQHSEPRHEQLLVCLAITMLDLVAREMLRETAVVLESACKK